MSELSPRARAMLGEYKVEVLLSAREDGATWAAIAQRIAANEPPLFDDAEPRRRPWWSWVTGSVAVAAAVAATVLLFTNGFGSSAMDEQSAMDAAPYEWSRDRFGGRVEHRSASGSGKRSNPAPEPEPAAEPDPAAEPESAESTKAEAVAPVTEDATASARARAVRGSSRRPAATADDLAAEASSLARARADLRDGRPDDALRRLARHARRFAQGALVKERRVLEILARCEAGQRSQARQEAQRFIRDNPGSPLTVRVRGICSR